MRPSDAQMDEVLAKSGLTLSSASSGPLGNSVTDTFEDYEDMQGVPMSEVQNQQVSRRERGRRWQRCA